MEQNRCWAHDETTARQRLLEAAADLFNRKGYAAASVAEIVTLAGVTKPVLYYYFRNKEGIFLEMMREGGDRFLGILEAYGRAGGGDVRGAILRFCDEILVFLMEHIRFVRVMHGIYYGPPQGAPHVDFDRFHDGFHACLGALVREGIARGEFQGGDPEAMTLAVAGAMSVSLESHLCHPERAVGRQGLAAVLQAIFKGFLPRGGRGSTRGARPRGPQAGGPSGPDDHPEEAQRC